MILKNNSHLSYCTNIHPGETWEEVFKNLQKYCIAIKDEISPDKPFGIGLRLSQKSASTLLKNNRLDRFKEWLAKHNLYVFTLNGFPYDDFHHVKIKDKVHVPDWTTKERIAYSSDLITILTYLLPEGIDGGISTSPLSYKLWFNKQELIEIVKNTACNALIDMVLQLIDIKKDTGKSIHLDLEPEPDGVLENTKDVILFYTNFLFKNGSLKLRKELNCSEKEAKEYILEHIQICYDVCHFALAFEEPIYVIQTLKKEGIKIGKIQISAALKCVKTNNELISKQQELLRNFDEPTYLHQSVVKYHNGSLQHFSDLSDGILEMKKDDFKEIRAHYHVPVFISKFELLESTQKDIISTLKLWNKNPFCNHLEIETYTWSVLPNKLQTNITDSIIRELKWTLDQIQLKE